MKITNTKTSPQIYARAVGLLSLVVIIAGIIAEMVISGKLVVNGDAVTTATNILAHKDLFQLGFAIYMIEMAFQIAQTVLYYVLLKPVNRSIALLSLFLNMTGCIIKTVSRLFYISPLLVLGGSDYLSVFSAEQLQAFALLFLNINNQAAGMALVFFGFSTFLNGFLIFNSTFLPRVLGVLSMIGGLGWLTYIYPPLGHQLFSYILFVALIGSVVEILWLLFKGVNVEAWQKRAAESLPNSL